MADVTIHCISCPKKFEVPESMAPKDSEPQYQCTECHEMENAYPEPSDIEPYVPGTKCPADDIKDFPF
jgi:hypothetical protein